MTNPESGKVRDEGRKNFADHTPIGEFQGKDCILTWGLASLPKRYAENKVEMHVHFCLGFASGRSIRRDFDAVFKRSHIEHEVGWHKEGSGK